MILLQYVIPIYTGDGGSLSPEGMKTLEGVFWFLNFIFIISFLYETYRFLKGKKYDFDDTYFQHTFLSNIFNMVVGLIDATVLLFVIGSLIGRYL